MQIVRNLSLGRSVLPVPHVDGRIFTLLSTPLAASTVFCRFPRLSPATLFATLLRLEFELRTFIARLYPTWSSRKLLLP